MSTRVLLRGSEADLTREPQNYWRADNHDGMPIFAHGRDPYFPGWPDTVQFNYRHRGLRQAMVGVIQTIADQCDGVRCDMAMLLLPDVIARTWGERSLPGDGSAPVEGSFWASAIPETRQRRPGFVFMAEAYWDLEWTLQQQGFDYTYDKRLYDHLHGQDAGAVRGHLHADAEFQRRSARFLENHDEPRAAAAFPPSVHRAAAVVTFLLKGLRFVHQGERSGRRLRTSNHLRRRATEPVDEEMAAFYDRLFAIMRRPELRDGEWRLLEQQPAWDGNPTWDRFIAFSWERSGQRLLVAVNYGQTQGQCYVRLPWGDLDGRVWGLNDLMNPPVRYDRDGSDLARRGLYLDLSAWGHHVFEIQARS